MFKLLEVLLNLFLSIVSMSVGCITFILLALPFIFLVILLFLM